MKFAEFLQEVGHPVAYHPNLCKITGSTLATLFLCQFVYWEGKQHNPDRWIYKTQQEIEAETGMKRSEQESARKQLLRLNLMEERRVGLPARLEYRPNLHEIKRQWEQYLLTGESEAIAMKAAEGKQRADRLKNASNSHERQFVLAGQTSLSSQGKQDCPTRTDILYTEITNIDHYTKNTTNQSEKVFYQTPAALPSTENLEGEFELSQQPGKLPFLVNPNSGGRMIGTEPSQPGKDRSSAKNSTKKEKIIRFPVNKYGFIDLPRSPKYRLPSVLTMRTLQFILAQNYLDCTFALDDSEVVYVWDPLRGDWWEEEEAFTSLLPLKKMIAIANSGINAEEISPSTYNKLAKRWFTYWLGECQRLGNSMTKVIGQKSIGLWLQESLELEFEDLEVELEDLEVE